MKKKPPKPEKGSPVYSRSTQRRLDIQQPDKQGKPATHGANCCCLHCRAQRAKFDGYGR